MTPDEKSWQRLVEAARKASPAGDESAPFGFSTRVAAVAFEQRAVPAFNFARTSLRAAAIAGLLALAAVAVNYSAIRGAFDGADAVAATDDPIAEVVDLGS
jgi:hypothetical protein